MRRFLVLSSHGECSSPLVTLVTLCSILSMSACTAVPNPDTILWVGSSECRAEGDSCFPHSESWPSVPAALEAVVFLGCQGTLLTQPHLPFCPPVHFLQSCLSAGQFSACITARDSSFPDAQLHLSFLNFICRLSACSSSLPRSL